MAMSTESAITATTGATESATTVATESATTATIGRFTSPWTVIWPVSSTASRKRERGGSSEGDSITAARKNKKPRVASPESKPREQGPSDAESSPDSADEWYRERPFYCSHCPSEETVGVWLTPRYPTLADYLRVCACTCRYCRRQFTSVDDWASDLDECD